MAKLFGLIKCKSRYNPQLSIDGMIEKVRALDPELVILGGGLGLCEGLYRQALTDSARRHIWWDGHRELPIVSAATTVDAGLIGAGATAWKKYSGT